MVSNTVKDRIVCMGTGGYMGNLCTFLSIFCKSKTALRKLKSLKKYYICIYINAHQEIRSVVARDYDGEGLIIMRAQKNLE